MPTWKRILIAGDVSDTHIGSANKVITSPGRTLTLGDADTGTGVFSVVDSSNNNVLSVAHIGDQNSVTVYGDLSIRDDIAGSDNSTLKIYNGASNFIGFKAPSLSGATTYTLPDDDGSADQVLKTDGSGNLSWVDQSGGSVDGSGAAGRLALWQDADTLTSDSGITYSASENKITAGQFTASPAGSGSGFFMGTGLSVEEIHVAASISPTNTDGGHGTGTRMFHKFPYSSTVIRGRVYFLRDGWVQADKDNANSANLLAVASNIATATTEMIAEGFVRMQSNAGFSNASAGTPVYIADDGHVSVAPPTGEGDIARVVGYVISGSAKMIYFRPDNTWITVD